LKIKRKQAGEYKLYKLLSIWWIRKYYIGIRLSTKRTKSYGSGQSSSIKGWDGCWSFPNFFSPCPPG